MKYRQNNSIEVSVAKASISRRQLTASRRKRVFHRRSGRRATGVAPILLSISSMLRLFRS